MAIPVILELATFFVLVLLGYFFGLVVDIYVCRTRARNWKVNVLDVVIFVPLAVGTFFILFLLNGGEVRLYSFLALVAGGMLYGYLAAGQWRKK